MKVTVKPTTIQGQWAALFTLLFILLMALKIFAYAIPLRLPFPNPLLALMGFIGFVLGIYSIFMRKERALLTWLSIPVGLIIIIWVAAEVVFPH